MTDPSAAVPPVAPASDTPWWVLPGLAVLALTVFAGLAIAAFFTQDTTLRTTMATAAVTMTTGAMGYFFGSSAGSARKDGTIAAQSDKLAASTPPPA